MDAFFWIFDLLISATVTAVGLLFTFRPPHRVNAFYGYRTRRSTASQEAWDTVHRLYGRVMLRVGPPLIVFVVIAKLLVPLPPEYLSLILLPFSFAALTAPNRGDGGGEIRAGCTKAAARGKTGLLPMGLS